MAPSMMPPRAWSSQADRDYRVEACNILNTHQLDSYRNKTDKIDSRGLLKILAYNEQMEPELQKRPYIYVPAK